MTIPHNQQLDSCPVPRGGLTSGLATCVCSSTTSANLNAKTRAPAQRPRYSVPPPCGHHVFIGSNSLHQVTQAKVRTASCQPIAVDELQRPLIHHQYVGSTFVCEKVDKAGGGGIWTTFFTESVTHILLHGQDPDLKTAERFLPPSTIFLTPQRHVAMLTVIYVESGALMPANCIKLVQKYAAKN